MKSFLLVVVFYLVNRMYDLKIKYELRIKMRIIETDAPAVVRKVS
jgi:hypothetical protein